MFEQCTECRMCLKQSCIAQAKTGGIHTSCGSGMLGLNRREAVVYRATDYKRNFWHSKNQPANIQRDDNHLAGIPPSIHFLTWWILHCES